VPGEGEEERSTMVARIRGWLVLAWASITMAVFFLISLPEMVLRGTGDLAMWFARHAWGPSTLRVAGVKLEVTSAPLPEGPLIFASNHESALDICALVAVLPRNVRFVAKRELFRIPVFGWYLRAGGHVPVDRANRASAVETLRRAAEKVRAGTSLIVFPEGTRSRDGLVHAFKKGPFVVAMEAGVPVVPVAISGAGHVNPKSAIATNPGTIRIAIGEAVLPGDHPDKTSLLVEVRRRVILAHRALGGLGGDLERPVAEVGKEGVAAGA
jgi:1-acyl-sn-glycerol-3-phosphate acyltransferase